ncbi:prephenate dehydratase [Bacillus carboniphilus]|uniref:Prephenate dehydratase n=1 Tax=Bacillus carboniphilus TaxID=86663 RepID=A0ABY9K0H1_9BACI|nr:prephenate dehydratase [Bacillus carboniphilus]WLR44073.1 prephenate dehydratase [Bacillus carboniphilus]
MKVGYLGPEATFTHLAVTKFMPKTVEAIPYLTIPQCMDAVANKKVDVGVVPLENAIEGSVNLTIDYLIHEQPLSLIGEMILPINQHLMVHPDNRNQLDKVEQIYSHSHAIAQCHRFIHENFPNVDIHYTNSTSADAQFVFNHPESKIAAIANELSSYKYDLHIVKENIHDYHENHTRFAVLNVEQKDPLCLFKENKTKTTLAVMLPEDDHSGALHLVLSAFAWRKLNLTKIESRPMKTKLGNYFFIIDIDQGMDVVLIPGAIAELEALGCKVKLIGSYPTIQLT